jgi:hypothetical protein
MLSFTGTGHLHPLSALGRELVRQGYDQGSVSSAPPACTNRDLSGQKSHTGGIIRFARRNVLNVSLLVLISRDR